MKYTVISVQVGRDTKCLAISGEISNTAHVISGSTPEQIAQQYEVVAIAASKKAIARQLGVRERDLQVIEV